MKLPTYYLAHLFNKLCFQLTLTVFSNYTPCISINNAVMKGKKKKFLPPFPRMKLYDGNISSVLNMRMYYSCSGSRMKRPGFSDGK